MVRYGPAVVGTARLSFVTRKRIFGTPMPDVTHAFLLVYAGLFPIVNPVGSAPIFLGLTAGCSDAERNALAGKVAINSVFLLIGSMFIGSHLLVFFGITLPVVRIAGGLVVATYGWNLLQSGADADSQRAADTAKQPKAIDSFYPLTMPLTVGPGAISVAIALGSQRPAGEHDWSQLAMLAGTAIAGILAIALTVFICYRFAERIIAMLGHSGTNVVVRLSAFVLLCIGIQIIWTGAKALIAE